MIDNGIIMLVATTSSRVSLFDLRTGKKPRDLKVPLPGAALRSMVVTRDERFVISGGTTPNVNQRLIYIWLRKSGELRHTLTTGFTNDFSALQLTPDGRSLISASRDGTLRITQLPEEMWPQKP